jgi:hypothetical protein
MGWEFDYAPIDDRAVGQRAAATNGYNFLILQRILEISVL